MRLGKILLTAVCAALFLLLLSALVVSPEADVPAPDPAPLVGARLLPLSLPMTGLTDAQEQRPSSPHALILSLACALCTLPALVRQRDANGRVLQSRRYENSVYQVFHPEVAGG